MKKRLTAAALSVVAAASLAVSAPSAPAHADTKDVVGKILFVPASLTVILAAQIAIYNALVDARMIEPLRRL